MTQQTDQESSTCGLEQWLQTTARALFWASGEAWLTAEDTAKRLHVFACESAYEEDVLGHVSIPYGAVIVEAHCENGDCGSNPAESCTLVRIVFPETPDTEAGLLDLRHVPTLLMCASCLDAATKAQQAGAVTALWMLSEFGFRELATFTVFRGGKQL